MRALVFGLLGAITGAMTLPACAPSHRRPEWSSPEVLGLRLGVADETAVRSKLGEPVYAGDEEREPSSSSPPTYILQYPVGDNDGGLPTFAFDRIGGTLVAVVLHPKAMTVEQAIERFGSDGIGRSEYEGPCPPGPAAPSRPTKQFTGWLVYPGQGLYMYVRYDGSVQQIEYRAACR